MGIYNAELSAGSLMPLETLDVEAMAKAVLERRQAMIAAAKEKMVEEV